MITAVIQARMTSTRLPGKVLADVCGKPMLEQMLKRVRRAESLDQIVVATTENAADDPAVALCERLGVMSYRGDEHDVLGRFLGVARGVGAPILIRLTADCPMIEPALIDQAVAMLRENDFDYVSNTRVRTYPDGLDVEAFTAAALEIASREAIEPELREHVTPYIHGGRKDLPSGNFKRGDLVFDADFGHLRWTVDYPEDLERIRCFFRQLPENFTWLEALSLATRQPDLLGIDTAHHLN